MRMLLVILLVALAAAGTAGATRPVVTPPTDPDCVIVIDSAAVWANFAPSDSQATFVGPPSYPTDARGTWIPHSTLPPGHAGPDGVYSRGNPAKGGNWFYRQAEVSHEECVEEPPVTCEEDPQQPGCDIPGDPNCQTDPELCPVYPPKPPVDRPSGGGGTTGGAERACNTAAHETGDQNPACASLPHTGLDVMWIAGAGLALLLAGGTLLAWPRLKGFFS